MPIRSEHYQRSCRDFYVERQGELWVCPFRKEFSRLGNLFAKNPLASPDEALKSTIQLRHSSGPCPPMKSQLNGLRGSGFNDLRSPPTSTAYYPYKMPRCDAEPSRAFLLIKTFSHEQAIEHCCQDQFKLTSRPSQVNAHLV